MKHVITHRPDLGPGQPPPKNIGLGDIVHAFANPIAKAIDSFAGTKISECGGCKARREALNRAAPNIIKR